MVLLFSNFILVSPPFDAPLYNSDVAAVCFWVTSVLCSGWVYILFIHIFFLYTWCFSVLWVITYISFNSISVFPLFTIFLLFFLYSELCIGFIQKLYSMVICICQFLFPNMSLKKYSLPSPMVLSISVVLWFTQSLFQWLVGVQKPSPVSLFVLQFSFCSQHLYFLHFGTDLYFDNSWPSFSSSNMHWIQPPQYHLIPNSFW